MSNWMDDYSKDEIIDQWFADNVELYFDLALDEWFFHSDWDISGSVDVNMERKFVDSFDFTSELIESIEFPQTASEIIEFADEVHVAYELSDTLYEISDMVSDRVSDLLFEHIAKVLDDMYRVINGYMDDVIQSWFDENVSEDEVVDFDSISYKDRIITIRHIIENELRGML